MKLDLSVSQSKKCCNHVTETEYDIKDTTLSSKFNFSTQKYPDGFLKEPNILVILSDNPDPSRNIYHF